MLVDRSGHHLFQPLLYQCATGILSEGQIAAPLRDVLKKHKNVECLLAEVEDVDVGAASCTPRAGRRGDRDPVRPPDRRGRRAAVLLRARRVRAVRAGDEDDRRRAGHPPPGVRGLRDGRDGVERRGTGAVADVRPGRRGADGRRAGRPDPRDRDPDPARGVPHHPARRTPACCSSTAATHRSSAFGPKLAGKAAGAWSASASSCTWARGSPRSTPRVAAVTEDGQDVRYDARTVLWTAGVEAPPLAAQVAEATGAEHDRVGPHRGRPRLHDRRAIPEIFVVGDVMTLNGMPGLAEVAMQSAPTRAGTSGTRSRAGRRRAVPLPRPRVRGLPLAAAGRVVSAGPLHLSGRLGWLVWLFIHIAFLTGYRNRFTAILTWLVAFSRGIRRERAFITQTVDTRRDVFRPATVRRCPRSLPGADAVDRPVCAHLSLAPGLDWPRTLVARRGSRPAASRAVRSLAKGPGAMSSGLQDGTADPRRERAGRASHGAPEVVAHVRGSASGAAEGRATHASTPWPTPHSVLVEPTASRRRTWAEPDLQRVAAMLCSLGRLDEAARAYRASGGRRGRHAVVEALRGELRAAQALADRAATRARPTRARSRWRG